MIRSLGIGVAGLVAALALAGGACTLFESDPPDRSCKQDDECFRAQGEHCDLASKTCVVGPDAATATFDATFTVTP